MGFFCRENFLLLNLLKWTMGLGKVKFQDEVWSQLTSHHYVTTTHHKPLPTCWASNSPFSSRAKSSFRRELHLEIWAKIGCQNSANTHTSMIQMQVSEKSGRPSNLSSSFSSVFRNSAASAFEADVASTWRNILRVQYRDEIQRSTIKKGLFISGYLHFLKQ